MNAELGQPVTLWSEGYRLAANLHLPKAGAPAVVTSHGLESTKDGDKWPLLAQMLSAQGIACLRFTHRGCPWGPEPSEGAFEDTTLNGRIADFRAALDFLSTTGVDMERLGAAGSSFGGMVALGAQDPRVRVLVLLATPAAINAPIEQISAQGGWQLGSGNRLRPEFFADVARYDLPAAVRDYHRPTLVLHGDQDTVVPVEHAYRLYQAAREPKRLEVISGGDHSFSRPEHRERALQLAVEWLASHLL